MGTADDTIVSSPEVSAEKVERGRKFFAQNCEFVRGVVSLDQLPDLALPEICFAGRSNVGKSSLLNALTKRKALARVSAKPGRTRELNFFSLGAQLFIVDLPGYGYARVSRSLSRAWQQVTYDYLRGRPTLARVFLLIDARVGPKPLDVELCKMLQGAGVTFQIVLTKSDKLSASALEAVQKSIDESPLNNPARYPLIAVTSARKGTGIASLRAQIASIAEEYAGA